MALYTYNLPEIPPPPNSSQVTYLESRETRTYSTTTIPNTRNVPLETHASLSVRYLFAPPTRRPGNGFQTRWGNAGAQVCCISCTILKRTSARALGGLHAAAIPGEICTSLWTRTDVSTTRLRTLAELQVVKHTSELHTHTPSLEELEGKNRSLSVLVITWMISVIEINGSKIRLTPEAWARKRQGVENGEQLLAGGVLSCVLHRRSDVYLQWEDVRV